MDARSRASSTAFVPVVALLLVTVACSGSGTGPEPTESPSVTIVESRVDLYVIGEADSLSVTLDGGASGPVTWTSADPTVVSVSSTGIVTALATGTTRVTAAVSGGAPDALEVVVDASTWGAVSTGESFACGLAPDGRAFCWGDNSLGQAGSGSAASQVAEPSEVAGGLLFDRLDSGEDHSCALTLEGDIYCWGSNSAGELGVLDERPGSGVPVKIASDLSFTDVSAGFTASCGVGSDGVAQCWGGNLNGQLGDGTTTSRRAPGPVAGSTRFLEVDMGGFHACGIDLDGRAHCWGANTIGWLGTGDTLSSTMPVPADGSRSFSDLSVALDHTCAVEPAGDIFCWGGNDEGQLGSASGACNPEVSVACSTTALRVPLDGAASAVSSGGFFPGSSCALTSSGTWCWGRGVPGPTRLEAPGGEFEIVVTGLDASYGIGSDGILYRWDAGDLGSPTGPTFLRVPDRRRPAG